MRFISLIPLCLGLLALAAHAEEAPQEKAADPLLAAVRACPLALGEAMGPTYANRGQPLGAEFRLDQKGRLVLRALVRVMADDDAWFEEWTGFVHGGGWVPHRQKITSDERFEEAARRWALLERNSGKIRNALRFAVPGAEHVGPAETVLSVYPTRVDAKLAIDMRVVAKGRIRGLRYEPETRTFELRDAPPAPKRVTFDAPPLPALGTIEGTWFNVESKPGFAAWKGRPLLVVITDPG